MKRLIKFVLTVIMILALIIIFSTSLLIFHFWKDYQAGTESYAHILELAGQTPDVSDSTEPDEQKAAIDFGALTAVNPDLIGWLYMPGTRINYPIVQRQNDNNFYLTHLFDGTSNKAGCIFLDSRCQLESQHTLIHGHNMANGSMFRDLNLFRNRDFLRDHRYYFILTPEKNYIVEIFGGVILRTDSPIWQLEFSDSYDVQRWLTTCLDNAYVRGPLTPAVGDNVITLSTCTYEYTQARWIVQGVLRDASDLSNDELVEIENYIKQAIKNEQHE